MPTLRTIPKDMQGRGCFSAGFFSGLIACVAVEIISAAGAGVSVVDTESDEPIDLIVGDGINVGRGHGVFVA